MLPHQLRDEPPQNVVKAWYDVERYSVIPCLEDAYSDWEGIVQTAVALLAQPSYRDVTCPPCLTSSPRNKMVSVDPGEFHFLNCYDPTDGFYCWGSNGRSALREREEQRAFDDNRVDDDLRFLHVDAAVWLISHFDVILMGNYVSHLWKSSAFLRLLSDMTNSTKGRCVLAVVPESGTTKTCGLCGHQSDDSPGHSWASTFSCSLCGYRAMRDFNGARNIMMKWLKTQGFDDS